MRKVSHNGFVVVALAALHASALPASDDRFFGLLRARDLTPFGYLRLDMRPSYAGSLAPGDWAFETELAYQNTWALSPAVERYLTELRGRRELGPAEYQAIRDLPGENYLLDQELAQLDVTLHHQISPDLGAYLILSGSSYQGGFLDGVIEEFHDTFRFSNFGRPAASRNDVNILLESEIDAVRGIRGADQRRPARPDAWRAIFRRDPAGIMAADPRITFAVTENLQNINNTPYIGFQLGWSYGAPRVRLADEWRTVDSARL